MKKILSLLAISASSIFAAPLSAPDTGDITGTIAAYGGAAVAIAVAYMLWPYAIRMLKSLFR